MVLLDRASLNSIVEFEWNVLSQMQMKQCSVLYMFHLVYLMDRKGTFVDEIVFICHIIQMQQ